MCWGTFSYGAWSWVLYHICFFAIFYAAVSFLEQTLEQQPDEKQKFKENSIWNP